MSNRQAAYLSTEVEDSIHAFLFFFAVFWRVSFSKDPATRLINDDIDGFDYAFDLCSGTATCFVPTWNLHVRSMLVSVELGYRMFRLR